MFTMILTKQVFTCLEKHYWLESLHIYIEYSKFFERLGERQAEQ